MKNRIASVLLVATTALSLAACGGHSSTTQQTTDGVATATPATEAQREAAALPMKNAAVVPADVHCGAAAPVWVNMRSKAYHMAGDPYYGRSKHGQYMCSAQATAAGYHLAGNHHHMESGGMMHSNGTYRKHHSGSAAAPMMTDTPQP